MICGREVVVQFLSATLCRAPQKLRLTVKLATTCLLLAARLEERISKWTDEKVTGDATAAGGWLILILEHGRQTRFGRAHVAGRLTVLREVADHQVRRAPLLPPYTTPHGRAAVAGFW
ncbi:hypothetical protein CLIM01_12988 [Colletotrichum limetticola]|uniref:Secreted protein n=1 Tax=Colletotrichum limetticola TaxID=1209924 RepID=A0ABQ9PI73_9PEZI|nr:hypothetical protein CLIM01_12988 [Colletotrichum limetticola]